MSGEDITSWLCEWTCVDNEAWIMSVVDARFQSTQSFNLACIRVEAVIIAKNVE